LRYFDLFTKLGGFFAWLLSLVAAITKRCRAFLAECLKAVSERARKLYVTKQAIIAKDIYLYNWEIFMFFDKAKTRSYDIWLLEIAAPGS
jgi:hypothetical protein